ncbi:MAG: LytTR family DNA-binding domain-containing protein [Bacteroidales bacterium]|nr:LytTR family DNA-binding domain-containing protein [Bacteroidales bacterium]
MIKVLIIDDEERARSALKNLINKHCPELSIAGEGFNVKSGYELIVNEEPDAVFLDIQMPDGTGFDLLEKIGTLNFKIVFVSAYDKFAIQAFKFSAIDYLQKPVEPEQLLETYSRLIQKESGYQEINSKLEVLLSNRNSFEKIALATIDGIIFVRIKEIIRCESDNNYTNIFLQSGRRIIVSKTLKEYEEMLTPFNFFRIHKSHLINLAFLQQYKKGEGGYVIMEDGAELEVSRRRKEDFMTALKRS